MAKAYRGEYKCKTGVDPSGRAFIYIESPEWGTFTADGANEAETVLNLIDIINGCEDAEIERLEAENLRLKAALRFIGKIVKRALEAKEGWRGY